MRKKRKSADQKLAISARAHSAKAQTKLERHKRALNAAKNKGVAVDYSASQVSTISGNISPALPR